MKAEDKESGTLTKATSKTTEEHDIAFITEIEGSVSEAIPNLFIQVNGS